jgi:hypothetical protein
MDIHLRQLRASMQRVLHKQSVCRPRQAAHTLRTYYTYHAPASHIDMSSKGCIHGLPQKETAGIISSGKETNNKMPDYMSCHAVTDVYAVWALTVVHDVHHGCRSHAPARSASISKTYTTIVQR